MGNHILILGKANQDLDYCNYYCNNYIEPNCQHNDLPVNEHTDRWSHIELGAGNYGQEGHTKTSQQMTVLMALTYVSALPNYVDKLPEYDQEPYIPAHQYAVLLQTLDQLVQQYGPRGIFHVNDLFEEYASYAVRRLTEYATSKGYNQVIIEVVAGDYNDLSPANTLEKYGKFLYDSAHLKNPEISFYNYGLDGNNTLADDNSRTNARAKLQQLANLSHKGLHFFPVDARNIFIPKEEYEEYINQHKFYQPTTIWHPVPYYFPEGPIINQTFGSVYFIPHNYSCSA